MVPRRSWVPVTMVAVMAFAAPLFAGTFTGPVSPYYLSNLNDQTIYVVQGTQVIATFSWAYPGSGTNSDGVLAIAGPYVYTRETSGGATGGGQYTLNGAPTGSTDSYPLPVGIAQENSFDGTSDGTHNYYVQTAADAVNGSTAENVYRTSLDWSNPVFLFSVLSQPGASGEYFGITYDPDDNSLWLSGVWTMSHYSLDGTLLDYFPLLVPAATALAYDGADHTLWTTYYGSPVLVQYALDGTPLQYGTPTGLPQDGIFTSGEIAPEPGLFVAVGCALLAGGLIRRRRR